MDTFKISLDEFVGYFDELEDPRITINQKHSLVNDVAIAMMAVLAGASGPTSIAQCDLRVDSLPSETDPRVDSLFREPDCAKNICHGKDRVRTGT